MLIYHDLIYAVIDAPTALMQILTLLVSTLSPPLSVAQRIDIWLTAMHMQSILVLLPIVYITVVWGYIFYF